ncbi:cyclin-dependent kinase 12-like [Homarus americanus]|uniref:cyclin-dependent kinase 12-like n=1 Tax=Homarus americanus TaxID=6706 RepID=UPI001C453590|nr:cyclin-dependent kinase 12-like [Homarus americanus]
MRRSSYSLLDQNPPPPSVDCEAQAGDALLTPEEETNMPSWTNLRAKILSFTRGRSKSPTLKSPGSRSPTCRSPTARSPALRSPANKSPASRSPTTCRSPGSKSPTARSPCSRSPTIQSPNRSPTNKSPPLRSPTQRWAPPPSLNKRGSFSRGSSRESRGSLVSPTGVVEFIEGQPIRRNSGSKVKRCLKKAFSLNLGEGVEDGGELESPVGGVVGVPGGRKVKLKIRSSPVEQVMEMTQWEEDEENAVAAARRTRKWSYHGTATPSSPVEAPKRHSFSTVSDRAGIVVTNNDLVSLLGTTHRLTPPGRPLPEDVPPEPPSLPNPRARGRSQSIAVCWDNQQNPTSGAKPDGDGPKVPITIRRTDCDYVALPLLSQNCSALETPEEEDEVEENEKDGEDKEGKLPWDSSGSTIDAGLLGSVIEQYLKTPKDDDVGEVASSLTGLQVK